MVFGRESRLKSITRRLRDTISVATGAVSQNLWPVLARVLRGPLVIYICNLTHVRAFRTLSVLFNHIAALSKNSTPQQETAAP